MRKSPGASILGPDAVAALLLESKRASAGEGLGPTTLRLNSWRHGPDWIPAVHMIGVYRRLVLLLARRLIP